MSNLVPATDGKGMVDLDPPVCCDAQEPTLRDRFAMAALTGLIACTETRGNNWRSLPETAYKYADLMLAARQAQPQEQGA